VISGEAGNANVIVFIFTRPGLEHTIYRTRGNLVNHYNTDAVAGQWKPSGDGLHDFLPYV